MDVGEGLLCVMGLAVTISKFEDAGEFVGLI